MEMLSKFPLSGIDPSLYQAFSPVTPRVYFSYQEKYVKGLICDDMERNEARLQTFTGHVRNCLISNTMRYPAGFGAVSFPLRRPVIS